MEIVQRMNEEHKYVDDDGIEWERVWQVPQAHVDQNYDPNNPKDFAYKTATEKGSIDDLLNRSQELSEKRAKNSDTGRDRLKDKYFDKWSKKRHGKRHPDDDR